MAMGICNDEDFEAEMGRLSKTVSYARSNQKEDESEARIETIRTPGWNGGRGENHKDVPETLRKVIADSALSGSQGDFVAKTFGVSPSSVDAYKKGAHSTASYYQPDPDLKDFLAKRKFELAGKARETLGKAIEKITDEKLDATKARDLAGIAKDMSAVVKNLEPDSGESASQTNIIFYSPIPKKEDDYPVIDMKEE